MKISLGADHAGYKLKEVIRKHLVSLGHEIDDFGTHDDEAVDYTDFVRPAAESVGFGDCDLGIVFGGSGNGEAIVANKVKGVRCGVCWDVWSAEMTKKHNNANVIALGGRVVGPEMAIVIVDTWLRTEFEGGRHLARINKIEEDGN
ncbi:ribose 5-phosphate isomerase B [Luteolibacter sp. AS25]|uniref:ribose 5-phosphate isomerase B n=1 Tax=Luteolibacter sp. AS25 TaxID=3135776 RepID=UPI00398AB910